MKNSQSARPLLGRVDIAASVLIALLIKFSPLIPLKGDMVAHFLLVDEIMKHGHIRAESFLNLNVLSYYPPGSHWLAAIVGWIEGSGLYGLSFVAIASVFFVYLMILKLVDANSPVHVVVFGAIFVMLEGTRSLIGWEILGNFFYPQLVGDLFFFGTLIMLTRSEKPWRQAFLILASGVLTTSVQPLIAIHIFAAGMMLMAYEGVDHWVRSRSFPTSMVKPLAVVVAAAALVVLLHPSFRLMRDVAADHNGELEFGYTRPLVVGLFCGLVAALNVARHIRWRTQFVDAVLGTAGLASACVMGMQFIALTLGSGSDYAVKKHMFIVLTLGAINGARLVAPLLTFFRGSMPIGWLVAPAFAGIAVLQLTKGFDTPIVPLDRVLNYANRAADHGLPDFKPGEAVDIDTTQPALVNLMVTLSAFQHPFRWIGPEDPITGAKYVMIRRTKAIDETCAGRFAEDAEYVLVTPACLNIYTPGDILDFRAGGNASFFMGSGWSIPEVSGTWTDGHAGSEINLVLADDKSRPMELLVNGHALVTEAHPKQAFDIKVNETAVGTWTFEIPGNNEQRTVAIPPQAGRSLKIVITPLNSVSPAALDPRAVDTRELGIHVNTLIVR